MKTVPGLLERGKRVIDLSADYRFRSQVEYETCTASPMNPRAPVRGRLRPTRDVWSQDPHARIVANPGCYTTTSILALAPALACNAVEPNSIIVDAMSGVSGAGRSKKTTDYLFSELNENVKAYGVAGHRHTPEIEQELAIVCGGEVRITFTPHLVPITRGILATCYADLCSGETLDSLHAFYTEFYADAPFVDVLPKGSFPCTQHVKGSNKCAIGLATDERTTPPDRRLGHRQHDQGRGRPGGAELQHHDRLPGDHQPPASRPVPVSL